MGEQFAMIPLTMLRDRRLLAIDLAVYASIDSYSDKQGNSWPGLRTIAADAKVSRPTVTASLNRLEQTGYIQKTKRRRNGKKEFDHNLYSLRFRAGEVVNDVDHVVKEVDHQVVNDIYHGGKPRFLGVVNHVSTNHNHKNHIKDKESTRPLGGSSPLPPSPSEPPTQTLPQTKIPNPKVTPPKAKAKDEGAGGVSKMADADKEAAHWAEVDGWFDEFWEAYPRKEAKARAKAAFRKHFPPRERREVYLAVLSDIRDRLEPYLDEAEGLIARGERRFIPHPTTWLNREFGDD